MNIEFLIKAHGSDSTMAYHSNNFPDNINFQIQDDIWLNSFSKFLLDGFLHPQRNKHVFTRGYKPIPMHCIVTGISHRFVDKIGHIILVKADEL